MWDLAGWAGTPVNQSQSRFSSLREIFSSGIIYILLLNQLLIGFNI